MPGLCGKADRRWFRARPPRPTLAAAGRGRRRRPVTARSESWRRVCIVGIANSSLCFSAHAFSSRLSSLRKRQSVPSAMIFCGADLMKPRSCSRSA